MLFPMKDFQPWRTYPDLTKARLSAIAEIIRKARHETVALHDPEHGDGPWSLGCRAYERICFSIREAAKQNDWLRILPVTRMLEFSFAIGSIPFRFYRGKADEPPDNYQFKTFGEIQHLQFRLDIEGFQPVDNILRLAVETDSTREVSSVTLVELDAGGNPVNSWNVPFGVRLHQVTPIQTRPIELPPITAEPLKKEGQKKQKSGDGISSVS